MALHGDGVFACNQGFALPLVSVSKAIEIRCRDGSPGAPNAERGIHKPGPAGMLNRENLGSIQINNVAVIDVVRSGQNDAAQAHRSR
jgi:hypothetical protein